VVSHTILQAAYTTVGAVLVLLTLPGTLELLWVSLAGVLPARRGGRARPGMRVAVVVPAHNEEGGIARTVASLLACDRRGLETAVVVVADNSTDHTAERAAEAGARVLVRQDAARRGKGYALNYAFGKLLAEGWEALAVVDADTEAAPDFLQVTAGYLAEGAAAVQCRYLVRNPGASLRTRLMQVALAAFNVLRPRGRERCGLSAGILGNGFALARQTLEAAPYEATSVVEDLEYHLRLVRAGMRVRFAAGTAVYGEMPAGGKGARTQRARWEGGRLRMAVTHALPLAGEVLHGRFRLLEPLLELLLPPLAFYVVLVLALLAVPLPWAHAYALAALAVAAFHVLAAVAVGGGGWRDLAALLAAPFYVAWKILLIPAVIGSSRGRAAWVRTERRSEGRAKP